MENNKFKTPLIQSAAILSAVVLVFVSVGSCGAESTGGGGGSILSSIGHAILFCIGMPIALGISIAILIAIYIAAVAMIDGEQASQLIADLKKKRTR